jgi:hypothetical protein
MSSAQDKFAAKLLRRLQAAGQAQDMRYVAEHFAFDYEGGRFHLDNAFAEYAAAGFLGKRKVLQRWVAGTIEALTHPTPATFEEARPHLLPYVRDSNYWHQLRLVAQAENQEDLPIPYEPLGGDLTVSAALDLESTIANLGDKTLADWGVTLADVLKAGQFNLRMRTPAGFLQIHPGVWASPYHDNYDASRITLTEVITHLQVRGDPVAFAIHRDHLLVTGADDEAGLVHVAEQALELIQDRRRVSGTPVRWRRGQWETFAISPGSVVHEPLRRLAMMSLALDYSGQHDLLQKIEGDGVYVANFSVLAPKDGSAWCSFCAWTKGPILLLPRTDRIGLVEAPLDKNPRAGFYEWASVEKVCSAIMEKRDTHPPRVRVKEFPTPAMLAELAPSKLPPR